MRSRRGRRPETRSGTFPGLRGRSTPGAAGSGGSRAIRRAKSRCWDSDRRPKHERELGDGPPDLRPPHPPSPSSVQIGLKRALPPSRTLLVALPYTGCAGGVKGKFLRANERAPSRRPGSPQILLSFRRARTFPRPRVSSASGTTRGCGRDRSRRFLTGCLGGARGGSRSPVTSTPRLGPQ